MTRRLLLPLVAGLILASTSVSAALAGGWATIVLDADPPLTDDGATVVAFTLLQHGETPVGQGTVTVTATHPDGGTVSAPATAGSAGHWTAALALPSAGEWTLTVTHAELEAMAESPLAITVGAPAPAPSAAAPQSTGLLAAAALAAIAALAGLGLLAIRRRPLRASTSA